ncbi:DUF6929 family protein [Hymenobacter endophyticus]|jgi:hypothetical protein|uniref:Uncharacterized protein n=1 Tax=Hymenobacter endophyticus TaxID=3076335 RepID=A0ABU3TJC6_9BACT|nr:hypothetical protein [Hymenobacter endophyticus]MDU0371325.1 hypothetical protein [Hymenobacter endophyticus]
MQALIRREMVLPNLPSASGVEIVGEVAYVIGDDAPFLYQLNAATLAAGARTTLFETAHFSTGRIPKDVKQDLECLTALTVPSGETGLLVLGSGATPAREQGFWVPLQPEGMAGTVYPLSLSGLYAALRQQLPSGIILNLEAAAATPTELLLFQRTVGVGTGNLLFRLPLGATWAYLQHQTTQLPAVTRQLFELPVVEGKPAGFSGAVWQNGRLLVTASVEDTVDAVQDGVVLGSFVGELALLPPDKRRVLPLELAPLRWPDGRAFRSKVEGVAVYREMGPKQLELLLVTDDDAGGSTAVVVELSL